MPTQDDLKFGAIAVAKYFAKAEQVNACLELQRKAEAEGGPRRPLGALMVEQGALSQDQVELILKEQQRQQALRNVGPYELLGKLGEGGMGAVFRARHRETGSEVALKILSKNHATDESFVHRFKREARAGLELNHPHILRTVDCGEDQGRHYLALDLVTGGDLHRRIEERKRLPEREALGIVLAVGRALHYAGGKGLIHRDIKPANIMFAADGRVLLSDFGLVKINDPDAGHLTQSGTALGTPHYIAPEQAMGVKDLDIRADIYSLGATLYFAVTGRTPFEGSSAYEVIAKHMTEVLTPPDELNPELTEGCVRVIERMLAKDRDDRYASPGELVADIERVLRNELPDSPLLDAGQSMVMRSAQRKAVSSGATEPTFVSPAFRRRAEGATGPAPQPTLAAPMRGPSPERKPDRARDHRAVPARTNKAKGLPPALLAVFVALLGVIVGLVLVLVGMNRSTNEARTPTPTAPPSPQPPQQQNATQPPTPPGQVRTPGPQPLPVVREQPPADPAPQPQPSNDWANAVDLLALVDPRQDAVNGNWSLRGGELVSDRNGWYHFELPYEPPAEYDYQIVFSSAEGQPAGRGEGEVYQGFNASDFYAQWAMWCVNYETIGFIWDNSVWMPNRRNNRTFRPTREAGLPERLILGRRITSLVEVRAGHVRAFVDGRLIAEMDTDVESNNLTRNQYRNRSRLGVGVYQSEITFHEIRVREVTGKGSPAR
ncbi:MAG: serine/threonine protein kinase [Planctomycetes bacterium]|nr:serine/threonine protein kinase [Planctomycetota bacterium]